MSKTKTTKATFIIPRQELQKMKDVCEKKDTTMSQTLRKFIREWIESNGGQK